MVCYRPLLRDCQVAADVAFQGLPTVLATTKSARREVLALSVSDIATATASPVLGARCVVVADQVQLVRRGRRHLEANLVAIGIGKKFDGVCLNPCQHLVLHDLLSLVCGFLPHIRVIMQPYAVELKMWLSNLLISNDLLR